MRAPRVLVVDDQPEIRGLIAAVVRSQGLACDTAGSLAEAGDRRRRADYDILVLDVHLGDGNGLSLAADGPHDPLAIVVTGGLELDTAVEAIRRGALDVVAKPFSVADLSASLAGAVERWRSRERLAEAERALAGLAGRLAAELECTARRAEAARDAAVAALGTALGLRDGETGEHCRRVAANCVRLARRLGFPEHGMEDLRRGACLHDVGKIGVSDRILAKPDGLSPEERRQMQQHPLLGARLLAPLGFLDHAAEVVRFHHERFDGLGYPDGLAGSAIPLGARIFAVVDAFDAMSSDRPYRRALSPSACEREIERGIGGQFDPDAARAFLEAGPRTWLAADAAAGGGGS